MKQRSFKVIGLTTTLFTLATPALAQQTSNTDVQRQLQELRARIQQLQSQLDEQQSQASANESEQTRQLAEENSQILEAMKRTEINGQLEFGATFNDWSERDKDTGGDLDFGKFNLGVDGGYDQYKYSLQYRFYNGYRFLHHGWLGYELDGNDMLKLGLVQTPFGNMDYGYLGWYGNLPYLAGFNDNQNAGIKWDHSAGAWDTSLAFFKSDQLGDDNEHYGANAVGNSAQGNTEENQLAGRVAYTFGQGSDYTTEVNLSAKGGQLYNTRTGDSGDNWQAALGLSGSYGNWLTLLQATTYEYNAENPAESVSGISDNVLQVGAFGFNYLIPAKGETYSASLAYSMDVNWGPVENLYFYNDFSVIDAANDYSPINGGYGNMDNPMLNDLGMKVTAGPYYAWFDIIANKNGLNYFGSPVDDNWHTSVQTHFGLTF
ncbi:hypothetical protein [Modicisalibacter tunisiensis]|uniref:Porin n=1 Tax=Modicisalibacter tunisiensis TaxID=390637 RepID=A0ABS7WYV0_9GAMM|nr:hypothetical protein [Modicisalibacter tunisiensis]MBZ9538784.1 hypothetical protein [Modicisalibacter tunisiensis]MBZ9567808.1 hypothetical protein [Modicisalibacter tunisiensis]